MSGQSIRYTTVFGTLQKGGSLVDDIIANDATEVTNAYESSISNYDTLIRKFSTQEFIPYTFPDTFILKPNSDLANMSISDIQAYHDLLFENVSSYTSTIYANQAIKTTYNIQQQNILSVIRDIDTDMITNRIQQGRLDTAKDELEYFSTALISTLLLYTSQLNYYSTMSTIENTTIKEYTERSIALKRKIDKDEADYASTLSGFSTISSLYSSYDREYKGQHDVMMSTSTAYDKAVLNERYTYATMISTNIGWTSTSEYLSSLYNLSTTLNSTLIQHRLDEYSTTKIRESTTDSVVYYSSLYVAAIAKRNYNMALSTQISTANTYMNSLSTYNGIKYIYLTSGGASNSIVSAAFALASQQLSTAILEESMAESTVSTFQLQATREADSMYQNLIRQYTRNVDAKERLVYRYHSYKISSLQEVSKQCTIYDTQNAIMLSSMQSLEYYSSLYISSFAGKSTLESMYSTNNSVILAKASTSDGYSHIISSLNIDYSTYNSSYLGWQNVSAGIYRDVMRYMSNISSYSTLYDSSIAGLSTIQGNIVVLARNRDSTYTQSSLLLQDYILLDQYQNDILINTNTQEVVSYKYKETCTRTKLLTFKQQYQDLVLSSIQMSSTFTGSTVQGLLDRGDTSYVADTTFPVNLDTPIINTTYNKIISIDAFLDVFAQIYEKYDKKNADIISLGDSIGDTLTAYNNFSPASLDAYINPTDEALLQQKNIQLGLLIQAQNEVIRKKRVIVDDISLIQSTVSSIFLSTYLNTFSPYEISQQNSTISSFIISGFSTAIDTYFQLNGIVIRL